MSISSPEAVESGRVFLFPIGFTLQPYIILLGSSEIMTKYLNSIIIILLGTSMNLFISVTAAYPLARKGFRLKKPLMIYITATMFFSGGLIPSYLIVQYLGLMNTFFSVVLPVAASAWLIIITRTYFMTIPESIVESAYIDGCSNTGILFKMMLPLSVPVIAVVVLYSAVNHWNSYFTAMLYLTKKELQPIQLYLARIVMNMQYDKIMADLASQTMQKGNTYKQHVKYAIIIITILPIMSIYPILQKYFVGGIMLGSIKE
jgi:ABC-type sugar transport system, permease component